MHAFHYAQKAPMVKVKNMKQNLEWLRLIQSAPKTFVHVYTGMIQQHCISGHVFRFLPSTALMLAVVEKIFGPGNQVVTAAKMISRTVKRMVSVDMPAGSSEVLVIADKHAGPVHIAADLLSQRTRSNSANTGWYCVEAQSCMNDISYQVLTYVATSLFWLFSLFQSWASFSATLCLN
ncbi:uncharacterized protein LOC113299827 [Papaver somniferum]|uniref:uncharacterized protein LOC113299827 n=1 Tax=Papaver somniferum TaxID=3469 RepID=UPI000E70517E|nr:uncharacterized protein LOC113299827 [Papaver somniferum]XP_026404703.1 uncharacterized protein LOC113299827 [Papaver somniferum]XP_026404704.1 uncharacterized protein LOC113299827 [Papaver somniferum]XP_026404705.1 uncharacterized protein LOC113299827 [Papaver somniferum]